MPAGWVDVFRFQVKMDVATGAACSKAKVCDVAGHYLQ